MHLAWGLLLLTGFAPLTAALRGNRRTTLRQPLLWALAAQAAWTGVAWGDAFGPGRDTPVGRYAALCLTGCAGVAVLGARRPGAGAWNFVIVGLLAVLLRPLLEGRGEFHLETAHWLFLAVTLAVPLVNYLPTRLAPAVVSLAAACTLETLGLAGAVEPEVVRPVGQALLVVTPWLAWAVLRRRDETATEFDRLWRSYRDRFGFVWGQRMREQFNRAAAHAGWPVVLRWGGLRPTGDPPEAAALQATLRAVLKRFTTEEEETGQ
jgi:hypothetical protein